MNQPPEDVEALRAANAAFYEAFERGDLDAMSEVWEHSDRVVCVHPGWPALHGWARVVGSWLSMFQGPERLQFILTDERYEVVGDVGWVSVEENILGASSGATVAALNLWVRTDGRWKLVAHHGAGVAPRSA
jgi:ketosteroid isomerase-like protein